jgi:DNA-binding NarL/FixJ family response regulator
MTKVVIVDDHAVVRQGLQQVLAAEHDLEVVGSASDGSQAVELVLTVTPDVVLMDLSMPDVDGVEATRRVLDAAPETSVVILTSFAEREHVLAAIEAGAFGFILKDAEPDEIVEAVRAAAAGGSPLDPRAARVLLEARRSGGSPGRPPLSEREREVLDLVAAGLANKQIARRLGIAERTVKAHMSRVFQALGVSDRTQAALWAQRHPR